MRLRQPAISHRPETFRVGALVLMSHKQVYIHIHTCIYMSVYIYKVATTPSKCFSVCCGVCQCVALRCSNAHGCSTSFRLRRP